MMHLAVLLLAWPSPSREPMLNVIDVATASPAALLAAEGLRLRYRVVPDSLAEERAGRAYCDVKGGGGVHSPTASLRREPGGAVVVVGRLHVVRHAAWGAVPAWVELRVIEE